MLIGNFEQNHNYTGNLESSFADRPIITPSGGDREDGLFCSAVLHDLATSCSDRDRSELSRSIKIGREPSEACLRVHFPDCRTTLWNLSADRSRFGGPHAPVAVMPTRKVAGVWIKSRPLLGNIVSRDGRRLAPGLLGKKIAAERPHRTAPTRSKNAMDLGLQDKHAIRTD